MKHKVIKNVLHMLLEKYFLFIQIILSFIFESFLCVESKSLNSCSFCIFTLEIKTITFIFLMQSMFIKNFRNFDLTSFDCSTIECEYHKPSRHLEILQFIFQCVKWSLLHRIHVPMPFKFLVTYFDWS